MRALVRPRRSRSRLEFELEAVAAARALSSLGATEVTTYAHPEDGAVYAEWRQSAAHPSLLRGLADQGAHATVELNRVESRIDEAVAGKQDGAGQWSDSKIPQQLAALLGVEAATSRVNLAVNPRIATDLNGLTATAQGSGTTFERVTLGASGAPAPSAAMSALGLTKGAHHITNVAGQGAGYSVAVTSGKTYQFSVYVWLTSLTAVSVRMLIQSATAVNKYAGTEATGGNVSAPGSWVHLVGSVTADATEIWRFVPAAMNSAGAAEFY